MKIIDRFKNFFFPKYEEEEIKEVIKDEPKEQTFFIKDNIVYLDIKVANKFSDYIHGSIYSNKYSVKGIGIKDFIQIIVNNPNIKFKQATMSDELNNYLDKKLSLLNNNKKDNVEKSEKVKIKTTKQDKNDDSDKVRKISLNDNSVIYNRKAGFKLVMDDENKKCYIINDEKEQEKPKEVDKKQVTDGRVKVKTDTSHLFRRLADINDRAKKYKIEKIEVKQYNEDEILQRRKKLDEVLKDRQKAYERKMELDKKIEEEKRKKEEKIKLLNEKVDKLIKYVDEELIKAEKKNRNSNIELKMYEERNNSLEKDISEYNKDLEVADKIVSLSKKNKVKIKK